MYYNCVFGSMSIGLGMKHSSRLTTPFKTELSNFAIGFVLYKKNNNNMKTFKMIHTSFL